MLLHAYVNFLHEQGHISTEEMLLEETSIIKKKKNNVLTFLLFALFSLIYKLQQIQNLRISNQVSVYIHN